MANYADESFVVRCDTRARLAETLARIVRTALFDVQSDRIDHGALAVRRTVAPLNHVLQVGNLWPVMSATRVSTRRLCSRASEHTISTSTAGFSSGIVRRRTSWRATQLILHHSRWFTVGSSGIQAIPHP